MATTDRVLITRPLHQGRSLMKALAAADIPASHTPLIEIQPCPEARGELVRRMQQLPPGSLVIAVSRPAARLAGEYLVYWPSEMQYWAVGLSTADQWQQVNPNRIRTPQQATSEGLLAMADLQQLAGRQVLILRGQGGRELLARTLVQRGAQVDYLELYRRARPALDGAKISRRWQQDGITILVATSGAILDNLQALVPQAEQAWLYRCQLIVVSERLAQLAHVMGFTQVTVAQGADNHSLITCLKQVLKRT